MKAIWMTIGVIGTILMFLGAVTVFCVTGACWLGMLIIKGVFKLD